MVRRMRLARLAVIALLLSLAEACGGSAVSKLHAQGKPTGKGLAELAIKNESGMGVSQLCVAKTEAVDKAREARVSPGTEADQALWGDDQLGNAGIVNGHTWSGLRLPPDYYDVLVVASDRREQLVKHLNLQAGGHYVLKIGDRWVQGRE